MATISIPNGPEDLVVNVPDKNLLQVIMPAETPAKDPIDAITRALQNPIGAKRLSEIAGPDTEVAFVVDSWNRPTNHGLILPLAIEELKKAGVKEESIKVIIAPGVHKKTNEEELKRKFGDFMSRFTSQGGHIRLIQHQRNSPMTYFGITSYGTPVWVNSEAVKSDLMIGVGQIAFNPGSGFSGGGTIVCPGMASYESIWADHRLQLMISDRDPRKGGDGLLAGAGFYTIRRDNQEELAQMVGMNYIINVVHNRKGEIVDAFAGDLVEAHREGAKLAREVWGATVPSGQADILVTSAHPRHTPSAAPITDVGFGLRLTHGAVKKGGTIIISHHSPWKEHPICHYGCPFWKECEEIWFSHSLGPEEILKRIILGKTPNWHVMSYSYAKALAENEVYFYNPLFTPELTQRGGMKYAASMQEALDKALKTHGPDAKVIVIPYGGRMSGFIGPSP